MKISICVTYYNQEEFVKQSMESILSIDFPCDFEILCGDDGSSDNTLEIIKEYVKKYPQNIKYFVMDRTETSKSINRASLNRLNLASNASGDYIMFLDGDDFYCDKSFIKEGIEILSKNNNLETCAFNYKYLYKNGSEKIFNKNIKEGFISATNYVKNYYTHSGAFIFRNVLDKNKLNFIRDVSFFDDNAISIYMLQFGDLYYFNKPVYVYRQADGSLWTDINLTEQTLVNALSYKLICNSTPKFKIQLIKRQFHPIKSLYKNRKKLNEQLGDSYDKYLLQAKNNKDIFVENLLQWNSLSIKDKIKTSLTFYKFKILKTFAGL